MEALVSFPGWQYSVGIATHHGWKGNRSIKLGHGNLSSEYVLI